MKFCTFLYALSRLVLDISLPLLLYQNTNQQSFSTCKDFKSLALFSFCLLLSFSVEVQKRKSKRGKSIQIQTITKFRGKLKKEAKKNYLIIKLNLDVSFPISVTFKGNAAISCRLFFTLLEKEWVFSSIITILCFSCTSPQLAHCFHTPFKTIFVLLHFLQILIMIPLHYYDGRLAPL